MAVTSNQPCPGIAQVTLHFAFDNQNIQNNLYFENTALWGVGDMAAIAAAVDPQVVAHVMPNFCADMKYLGCVATDLTSLTTERHSTVGSISQIGTEAGESAPANTCLAISFLTGSRGKGQQGRVFMGPLPQAAVNGDVVSTVWAGLMTSALDEIVTAAKAVKPGTQNVVLSRYLGGVKRPDGIGKLVTAIAPLNFYADSQRDRLPFHKRHKRRRTPLEP